MRPTLRCVLMFAAGIPISLLPVVVAPALWSAWLGYLGAASLLAGVDALLCLPCRRLSVAVRAPDTLYIGDTEDLIIDVQAAGWRSHVSVELIVDLHDDLQPHPARRVTVAPGRSTRVSVPLAPRRRGEVSVDRVWLRWAGPFGLMRRRRVEPVGCAVSVVPDIRAVRAAAMRWCSSRERLAGRKAQRTLGDGSEFDSLRDHAPGMDHRAIHWKASARHLELLCQTFRAERDRRVVIAIDTGRLMSEPLAGIPRVDHAINAGLLLGYVCLRTGDRVGLFGFDERVRAYVAPAAGVRSFSRLQRHAAGLRYHHAETNFTLGLAELSIRLRRRSLIVLLTDFVDTISAELMLDNIHRLGRRHLVVFVTLRDPDLDAIATAEPRSLTGLHRAVVAGDLIRERDVVLQRLERLGVHCMDVPPGAVSARLLDRYLDIKRRELI